MSSPAPDTPARATLGGTLWLIPAGAICGFGLGALALALAPLPAQGVAAPPPMPEAQPQAAPAPSPRPRDWPALFGTPPPPPPTPPEPVADPAPAPEPVPPPQAILRGLAMDDDGGWALIEIDGQVALVRPGSPLDAHHVVAEILADGVLIAGPEAALMLGFDDSAPAGGTGTVRESLARSYLRGAQDLFDMPMPLPPAGYIPGPGFGGMTDR
jgi:hypothetical protein